MRHRINLFTLAHWFAILMIGPAMASPVHVTLQKEGESTALLVDGQPFEIKGVGGGGSLALLQSSGGNVVRTWGIDESTPALLDEAHRHGIKVALGFWLGHERHGFDYSNEDAVIKQAEDLFAAVKKFKDHPALLLWGLGNEMEGFGASNNPAIFLTLEYLARRVKEIDPHHPVMTVTAEIGKRQVEALNRFCPSIDIHGINSYGGIVSLPERYRKAGGSKPYLVTEFGPPGTWETKPNQWGMPDELSSTAKAAFYRKAYQTVHADPLCFGSFAFVWGSKQEASATWFGMLLPSGEKLECVDAMTELWTGKPPPNRCPSIESIALRGPNVALDPGSVIEVDLKASDPENDPLSYRWVLSEDWKETAEGGDHRPTPPTYPDAILNPGEASPVKIKIPDGGGTYRIYAYVKDGKGGAATANLSIMVKGDRKIAPAEKLSVPAFITGTENKGPWAPSGWMGDTAKLGLDENSTENPKTGQSCTKVTFNSDTGWAGVSWQHPVNDWGDAPGGFDLSGATKLSFYARGSEGGEKITIGIGLIGNEKIYHDSTKEGRSLTLTREWTRYEFDLTGKNLSRIKTPLYFSVAATGKPFSIFIDEAVIE